MVGFDTYHYRYDSGREGDSFVAGFAPGKRELTLYLAPEFEGRDAMLADLGRHRTGKSCLYLKRLADVDLEVLERMVVASVEHTRRRYPAKSSSSAR